MGCSKCMLQPKPTRPGKTAQMFLSYGISKETPTIIMFNKNTIAMIRSPDGVIDFFDIVIVVYKVINRYHCDIIKECD